MAESGFDTGFQSNDAAYAANGARRWSDMRRLDLASGRLYYKGGVTLLV